MGVLCTHKGKNIQVKLLHLNFYSNARNVCDCYVVVNDISGL